MHSCRVRSREHLPSRVTPGGRGTSFEPVVATAFGAVTRQLRVGLGVAQDQLALQACVDRSYFGKLERGERQPSLGILLRIAKALGVSGAELVRRTEAAIASSGKAARKT